MYKLTQNIMLSQFYAFALATPSSSPQIHSEVFGLLQKSSKTFQIKLMLTKFKF